MNQSINQSISRQRRYNRPSVVDRSPWICASTVADDDAHDHEKRAKRMAVGVGIVDVDRGGSDRAYRRLVFSLPWDGKS